MVQVHRFFCHFQSLEFDIFSLMREGDRIIRRKASENEPFMRLTDVSSKKFLCICTIMMVMMMVMISDVDDDRDKDNGDEVDDGEDGNDDGNDLKEKPSSGSWRLRFSAWYQ